MAILSTWFVDRDVLPQHSCKAGKKKMNGTKDLQREQRTHAFIILTRNHYLIVKVKQLNNSGLQTASDQQIPFVNESSHVNIKAICTRHGWEFPVAFFHNITVTWCCIKNAVPWALNCNPAKLYSLKYFPCSPPIFKTLWAAGKRNQALKGTIVRNFFWEESIFYSI